MKDSNLNSMMQDDGDQSIQALKRNLNVEYARTVVDIRRQERTNTGDDESTDSDENDLYSFKPPLQVPEKEKDKSRSESSGGSDKACLVMTFIVFFSMIATVVGMHYSGLSKLVNNLGNNNNIGYEEQEKYPKHSVKVQAASVPSKSSSNSKNDIFIKNNYFYPLHSSPFIDNVDIPVLLDLTTGTIGNDFTGALSKCFGLKSKPANLFLNNLQKNKATEFDFLTVESLCALQSKLQRRRIKTDNHRFRVFLLIQNPIINYLQNYIEMKDSKNPRYDKRISQFKNFTEYYSNRLTISSNDLKNHNNNTLTRSILCKTQGDLTNDEFSTVKLFLSEKAYVGDLPNYIDLINNNQNKFRWKKEHQLKSSAASSSSSAASSECIKNHLKQLSLHQSRLLQQNDLIIQDHLFHQIYEDNFYDFDIYLNYIKERKQNNV